MNPVSPSIPVSATAVADDETPSVRGRGGRRGRRIMDHFERFALFAVFAALFIVFSVLRPETFPTADNWRAIATTYSVLTVLAISMLPALTLGRFDVSVGANMTLCAIFCAALMSFHEWSLLPAILVAICVGTLVGAFNGIVIAYAGVNSIIATIGVAIVIGGVTTYYTQGVPISEDLSPALVELAFQRILGIPVLFILMLVVAAICWFLFTETRFGRYILVLGDDMNAAVLNGIAAKRVVLASFVLCGLIAGVAGVLLVATNGSATAETASLGVMLPALAAAFLGATTWQPGRYNVPGTVLSMFFLGMVASGLGLLGAQPWVTDFFNGSVLLVAVAVGVQIKRQWTGTIEIGG